MILMLPFLHGEIKMFKMLYMTLSPSIPEKSERNFCDDLVNSVALQLDMKRHMDIATVSE